MLIFKANTRNLPENETVKAIEIQDMKGRLLKHRLFANPLECSIPVLLCGVLVL